MHHEVTEHTLKSGAKGLVIHIPGAVVTRILVRFNSGHQFTDQTKYEIPHIMEHMLATVSEKYSSPNAFFIEATKNGAYMNATTSSDANGYIFECADFERGRILDLVEEELVRPLFDETAFAAEVGNVREELSRNTTDYGRICNLRLSVAAYPGQAMDFTDRIAQLDGITLDDLKAHYYATHTARNARFYIAGDMSEGKTAIVARFETLFAQLEPGERKALNPAIGLSLNTPLVQTEDIKQLYYTFDRYLGELTAEERPVGTMLRLLLVGGMGSLIFGEARRRGLAYGVSAGLGTGIGNSSFGFSGQVTPANSKDLFEVIARHWGDIANGTLDEQRIKDAKALGIGSIKRSNQTVGDVLSWYVGSYDSQELILDFDTYLAGIDTITKDQIVALTRKITDSKALGISFVGEVTPEGAEELAVILRK